MAITRDEDCEVWKFPLALTDYQQIDMPAGSEILTVQVQDGRPCLWAKVDKKAQASRRGIFIVGTGHLMPVNAKAYIGTFQRQILVFHVFGD